MAEDMLRRLLAEQRRRLVGGILGAAETSAWWSKVTPPEQRAFREKVLASIGVYYDLCLDLIKVGGEDGMRNEHALTLIMQVHESQRRLEHLVVARES